MLSGIETQIVNLKDGHQFREVQAFLGRFGLTFDQGVEYTLTFLRDGRIIGTGSFTGEVLHNIAVDQAMQGQGLVSAIVSELIQELARRGRFHYFIFTKPCLSRVFEKLGFVEIACAEPYVSLLETGIGSVSVYCDQIEKRMAYLEGERAAVVLNENFLAEGNRIVEQASEEHDAVIVFVSDGLRLAREKYAYLNNVMVFSADKYTVSSEVFPTYFIRREDQLISRTRLDAMLFATQIAPRLDIKTRYVADPTCSVTSAYNQAMQEILPVYGIDVRIIKPAEQNLISIG
ncbi:GNAT family N-acetyltransferase [Ammoniphilus sp. 3BR4]|uniref:GNAT family N-acetyltransferase n=1 Tax=Ammoniphilus sp. 3BR4 TaxID=3158265 RepID=UPI003467CCA8